MQHPSLFPFLALAAVVACGEPPPCSPCRSDDQCGVGETCLQAGPNAGTCARMCSLIVWHVGEGYDAPCIAGVGNCPETCSGPDGVFGHCTAYESLVDVGVCREDAGELVCPE